MYVNKKMHLISQNDVFSFQVAVQLQSQQSTYKERGRYPSNGLSAPGAKLALKQHLVEPVYNQGQRAVTMRMVWRDAVEDHWNNIVDHRASSDSIIKQLEGISFFVSAIAGLYNHSPRAGMAHVARTIYPAIGFWIVLDKSNSIPEESLIQMLTTKLQELGGEVSIVRGRSFDTIEHTLSSLCIIVKDFSNAYVREQVNKSSLMCCRTQNEPVLEAVVLDTKYKEFLEQAATNLVPVKVVLDIQLPNGD